MDSLEQDSLQFFKKLLELYLGHSDPEALVAMLDQEIEIIGTGRYEVCHGLEAATLLLERESRFPQQIVYSPLDIQLTAKALGDGLCEVHGFVVLREEDWDPAMEDLHLRISALCRRSPQGIRLFQVHLSTPSLTQADGETFPRFLLERDPQILRRMLSEQARELQDRNRDLDALTNNIPGGVLCCDCSDDLNLFQFSDGFCSMFGYTREDISQLFDSKFFQMICPEDREPAWRSAREQLSRGNTKEMEYRVRCKDGRLVWVLDRGQLVVREDGSSCFYCILIDITQNKEDREALRMSLERHQVIMDQTNDIIFEWDIRKDSILFSRNWEKKFGYKPLSHDLANQITKRKNIHPDDLEEFFRAVRTLKTGASYCEVELRLMGKDGLYRWFRLRATLQTGGDGRPAKAIGVIIDIDREKCHTQMLVERAERDALTGLYNKGTAQEMMEAIIPEGGRGLNCAMMIIDVDNFKQVNDGLGHLGGDAILTNVSSVLRRMFREYDVVGRIGGDEFCILMQDISDRRTVEQKAQSILEAFHNLLDKKGSPRISCSIGIALAPQDGTDFTTVFRSADLALYHVKQLGKNGYQFYSPGLAGTERFPGCQSPVS